MKLKFNLIFFSFIITVCLVSLSLANEMNWLYYSSSNGDIPAPNSGNQQTASLILDIDKDGVDDFVITERTRETSVVWYKFNGGEWDKYVIEKEHLRIEAGGDFYDIDKDGDLDIVFAGDARSNQIWWWENPHPQFDPKTSWKRRIIKDGGANKHHDQIFGDFDGDGKVEFVSWNQMGDVLLLFEIPRNPRKAKQWKQAVIFTAENGKGKFEGLAKADVDLDGKIDIVGAGRWFKHEKRRNFRFT